MPSNRLCWAAVEHYGLDKSDSWMLYRMEFSWTTKRKPVIRSLTLSLKAYPVAVPGPRFTPNGPGSQLRFCHPLTGQAHTLTVLSYEQQDLGEELDGDGWT